MRELRWSESRVLDAAIAGGAGAIAIFGTMLAAQNQPDARDLDVLGVALLVAGAAALLARRRHPVAVLLAALVTTFTYEALDYPGGPIWGALIVAFFTAHTSGHRTVGFLVVLFGLSSMWWMPEVQGRETPSVGEGVALTAWLLTLVAVAEVVRIRRAYLEQARERARELERAREEEERRRRSDERLRIARELHDVLAHDISLINVQSSTALHLLDDDPEHARPALAAIKDASADALRELRSVLDTLRAEEGAPARQPAPTLAQLGDLIAQARVAGLEIDTAVEGEARTLPSAVELAAYRICQEAVTNVLRHAGPARARMRLAYRPDELVVEVDDDGRGASGRNGGGKGLTGMRERAAALGGTFEAGPRPGGGFRVRASLPAEPAR